MSNIKFCNLHFSYEDKEIFNNINYTLEEGKSLSIIGTSSSGKTTLLKLLAGKLEYKGKLLIDNKLIDDKNKVSVIFKDTEFLNDTVIDELKSEIIGVLNSEEIAKRLEEVNTFFNVINLYEKQINELTKEEKVLIKILSIAIGKPKFLALDDLFIDLSIRNKILLLNYFNCNNITLINVTSDLEDVIYTDCLLCLYDSIIAIEGPTLEVLSNEKILKRLGFQLPFYYDISLQLQLYDLISKICLNKEEMVKELWK